MAKGVINGENGVSYGEKEENIRRRSGGSVAKSVAKKRLYGNSGVINSNGNNNGETATARKASAPARAKRRKRRRRKHAWQRKMTANVSISAGVA